jgi:hypothetical protein
MRDNTYLDSENATLEKKPKRIFRSSHTKNACYNICQKTIKVIKKGMFDKKLQSICQDIAIDMTKFKESIIKKKK